MLVGPVSGTLDSTDAIETHLQQTDEWKVTWASRILDVLRNYDSSIKKSKPKPTTQIRKTVSNQIVTNENLTQVPRPDRPTRNQKVPTWRTENMDEKETYMEDASDRDILKDKSNRIKQRKR